MTRHFPQRLGFGAGCVLMFVSVSFFASPAEASFALQEWNMETRLGAPLALKIWLGSMLVANLASVFFLRRHVPARWVLGAFVVSHLWITYAEATGAFVVYGGMVSLGHIIFWTPAILSLLRHRDQIVLPSRYGIWACIMLGFYGISLIFDVRDAGYWIGSHFQSEVVEIAPEPLGQFVQTIAVKWTSGMTFY